MANGIFGPVQRGLLTAAGGLMHGGDLRTGMGNAFLGFGQGYEQGLSSHRQGELLKLKQDEEKREAAADALELEQLHAMQTLFNPAPPPAALPTGAAAGVAGVTPMPMGPGAGVTAQAMPPVGRPTPPASGGYNPTALTRTIGGTPGGGSGMPGGALGPAAAGATSPWDVTMQNLTDTERWLLPQMKPNQAAAFLQGKTNNRIGNTQALRKEFLKESADFIEIQDKYSALQAAAPLRTGAGDIAMIFSFMKMLDPSSVVRESEFETAARAGSVPEQIRNLYAQYIENGRKLPPKTRADMRAAADRVYAQQSQGQRQRNTQYGGIAERSGFPVENAVPDLFRNITQQPAQPQMDEVALENLWNEVDELLVEVD